MCPAFNWRRIVHWKHFICNVSLKKFSLAKEGCATITRFVQLTLVDLINEHHPFISSFILSHIDLEIKSNSEFPFRKFLVSMLNSFIHEKNFKTRMFCRICSSIWMGFVWSKNTFVSSILAYNKRIVIYNFLFVWWITILFHWEKKCLLDTS